MTMYVFQSYPASAKATFDCPACGKAKRTRTFRHECTVNPYNKNVDGTIKTPREVRQQSAARAEQERIEFLRKPLCKSCENALTYTQRKAVFDERRPSPSQER